jgi:hypothetical protein
MSLWARIRLALAGGPIGDIGSDENAATVEDRQMTVTLPRWTRAALRKAHRSEDAINARVRESPWGAVVASLPWGSVVDVFNSTVAPEPGPRAMKTWFFVRSIDDTAVCGWMHEDVLR